MTAPILNLVEAGFTYRGNALPALSGVDLSIRAGEIHAVLGPQGSGTSTLCRLSSGLLNERGTVVGTLTTGGEVVMLGDDPEAQLTGMTSIVADEVQLPARLRGLSAEDARRGAQRIMASLRIPDLAPRRLETLSGGQRQLVALAAVLSLSPALLVLDQPSLSLDPEMRARVLAAVQEYRAAGGAVLLTGHQYDELAEAADRVHMLAEGRLVETLADPGQEVITSHGVWDLRAQPSDTFPRTTPPGEDPEHPLVQLLGVSVDRGGKRVLDRFDLGADSGEVVTLVGPNGVGKSTLLHAMLGLLDKSARVSGRMSLCRDPREIDLEAMPTSKRAAYLGWVGQDPGAQLSRATVAAELWHAVPLPLHRRRDREKVRAMREAAVASAMEALDLSEFAHTHPYDLSPAHRKDLVMAGALLADPDVMLLDEPTLGRDLAAIKRLNAFIADFTARGGAVITTTHDERWARLVSHRIVRLGPS